jgi:hypothetical protein
LQDALLALPQQLQQQLLTEEDVRDNTLQIYSDLAEMEQPPSWLRNLLNNHQVLLVEDCGQLQFKKGNNSQPIYLADDSRLAQLFAGSCCVLAVPPEQLPQLQPLLQLVKPPLKALSVIVQRSYAAAAGGSEGVPSDEWTGLLQSVLPLISRCAWGPLSGQTRQLMCNCCLCSAALLKHVAVAVTYSMYGIP